ncbi:MAG: phosphotransferase, partial [Actinobacteria bacterium]|nr:phosphotransferase [Actinomycetota bacterium]
ERARLEAAAYLRLQPLGAPVPKLRACQADARGIAREWVEGESLATALHAGTAVPGGLAIAAAWQRLVDTLAPWTHAVTPGRLTRVRRRRLAELEALAASVAEAPPLEHLRMSAAAIGPDVRALPQRIVAEPLALVPLDVSPSNVIVTRARELVFVDLEAIGLDHPCFALCKVMLLSGRATADGVARSALVGLDSAVERASLGWSPLRWEALDAAHLLLALADAWRPRKDGDLSTRAWLAVARLAFSPAQPMAAIRATLR